VIPDLRAKSLIKVIAGAFLSVCACQAAMAADAPAARRTLTPDDLYRVEDVSEPQVSPDGAWVAYVVTTNERESDQARSAIWMVSWDGSQRLALTAAAEGTDKPRWSPDGRYLAFLAMAPGSDKGQIMLLDRRGGEARQLTHVGGDIGDYAWSPDGKRVVLVIRQSDAKQSDANPDQSAEEKSPKPIVIDALHFKEDEDGYLAAGVARHLYLLDVESKHLENLTLDKGFNESLPVWSPDGRTIAFVRTHEQGPDPDGREDIDVSRGPSHPIRRSLPGALMGSRSRTCKGWNPSSTPTCRIIFSRYRLPGVCPGR